jgi:hypothetical protein
VASIKHSLIKWQRRRRQRVGGRRNEKKRASRRNHAQDESPFALFMLLKTTNAILVGFDL